MGDIQRWPLRRAPWGRGRLLLTLRTSSLSIIRVELLEVRMVSAVVRWKLVVRFNREFRQGLGLTTASREIFGRAWKLNVYPEQDVYPELVRKVLEWKPGTTDCCPLPGLAPSPSGTRQAE